MTSQYVNMARFSLTEIAQKKRDPEEKIYALGLRDCASHCARENLLECACE